MLMDRYFEEQKAITDSYISTITTRFGSVQSSLQPIADKLSFLDSIDPKVMTYFNNLWEYSLSTEIYKTNCTEWFEGISAYVAGIDT